ncbi:FHA domain-containing protein, partial [Paracoccus versutus]|uniref:FHA domain-containing protein n=1 Tax=Paracoccus versutus TaxID=34007 RepID=UPI00051D598B
MTLRLTVLTSPVPQPRPELRLEGGRAVLGREPGCDWQIDDPEMFVSRRHCIVEATAEGWTVTDTSSGGLFIDAAAEPLGPGRSAALCDGMRLRLGDVTLGVAVEAVAGGGTAAPPPPRPCASPLLPPPPPPPPPPP